MRMTPEKNALWQKCCAWSGIVFLFLFVVGWWILADLLPPPSPTWSAEQVASMYRENTTMMRTGLMMIMLAAAFTAPWVALFSIYINKIEGTRNVLSYTQLSTGTLGVAVMWLPAMIWTTAAFRPDRNPELIQLMNDFGWLLMLMTFSLALIQNIVIGIAILSDQQEQPLFPRWSGYFNIWVAIIYTPAALITFFKTGPFAWDGIIAFWIPALVFFAWFLIMLPLLLKAINQDVKEQHIANKPSLM